MPSAAQARRMEMFCANCLRARLLPL